MPKPPRPKTPSEALLEHKATAAGCWLILVIKTAVIASIDDLDVAHDFFQGTQGQLNELLQRFDNAGQVQHIIRADAIDARPPEGYAVGSADEVFASICASLELKEIEDDHAGTETDTADD